LQYIAAAVDPQMPTPPSAPNDYIRVLFAEYAPTFDHHLRDVLKCRVPQQLLKAVRAAGAGKNLDVLDLGCGTGLVGEAFRGSGRARILVGVDLCPEMLQHAAARRTYTQLIEGDILAYLRGSNLRFDLVVAGDVFIYVGDLTEIFGLTAGLLKTGGLFAFSAEAQDEDGYCLRSSRRYTHGIEYIKKLTGENGFTEVSITRQTLRRELDHDVIGWIVVLRRNSK
jgi:predicted TPR repeat methyltransferase